ncbi:MAG: hypothetical protein WCL02_10000 [bacterium]
MMERKKSHKAGKKTLKKRKNLKKKKIIQVDGKLILNDDELDDDELDEEIIKKREKK